MRKSLELAKKFGISEVMVYKYARKLGRLPTEQELANRNKAGRPNKWASIEPLEAEEEQEEQE